RSEDGGLSIAHAQHGPLLVPFQVAGEQGAAPPLAVTGFSPSSRRAASVTFAAGTLRIWSANWIAAEICESVSPALLASVTWCSMQGTQLLPNAAPSASSSRS